MNHAAADRGGNAREFHGQAFAGLLAILEPDGGLIAVILVLTGDQVAIGAVYITAVASG